MAASTEYQVGARAQSAALADLEKGDKEGHGCWYATHTLNEASKLHAVTFSGACTGKDVCVGVIDNGFDVFHPGFFHITEQNGVCKFTSRIEAFWNQYQNPATGDTVARKRTKDLLAKIGITKPYGTVFERAQIEAALTAYYYGGQKRVSAGTTFPADFVMRSEHGTNTALLAAGHGAADDAKKPIGIAPEAALILVKTIADCHTETIAEWKPPHDYPGGVEKAAEDFIAYIAQKHGTPKNRQFVINKSYGNNTEQPYRVNERSADADAFLTTHPKGAAIVTGSGNHGDQDVHRHFKTRNRPKQSSKRRTAFQAIPLYLIDKEKQVKACDNKYEPLSETLTIQLHKPPAATTGDAAFGLFAKHLPDAKKPPVEGPLIFQQLNASGQIQVGMLSWRAMRAGGAWRSAHPLAVPGYNKVPLYAFVTISGDLLHSNHKDEWFTVDLVIKPDKGVTFPTKFTKVEDAFKMKALLRSHDAQQVNCVTTGWVNRNGEPRRGLFFGSPLEFAEWDHRKADAPVFSAWDKPDPPTKVQFQVRGRAALSNVVVVGSHDADAPQAPSNYSMGGPVHEYIDALKEDRLKPDVSAPGDISESSIPTSHTWNPDKTAVAWPATSKSWGTSYACPSVTGAIALMMEKKKDITYPDIERFLQAGAMGYVADRLSHWDRDRLGVYHDRAGNGPLQVFESVRLAAK